jgi:AAA15 family ATPase/GTPase
LSALDREILLFCPGNPHTPIQTGQKLVLCSLSQLPSKAPTESRAQLLFTTHDPLLLDQELLRRDEIWFIDKLEDGHSKLTALSDFKGIRYDKDIRKNYLLGRFAGLPPIRQLPRRHTEPVTK